MEDGHKIKISSDTNRKAWKIIEFLCCQRLHHQVDVAQTKILHEVTRFLKKSSATEISAASYLNSPFPFHALSLSSYTVPVKPSISLKNTISSGSACNNPQHSPPPATDFQLMQNLHLIILF